MPDRRGEPTLEDAICILIGGAVIDDSVLRCRNLIEQVGEIFVNNKDNPYIGKLRASNSSLLNAFLSLNETHYSALEQIGSGGDYLIHPQFADISEAVRKKKDIGNRRYYFLRGLGRKIQIANKYINLSCRQRAE